jgi:hypothetical protein
MGKQIAGLNSCTFFRIALIALLLSIVSSCTSISVKSNKDASASRKINRLFVIVNHGEVNDQKYSNELIQSLKNCLSNSPVQLEFSVMTPLDLNPEMHQEKVRAFDAEAVLVISVSTYVINEFGGYPTILYDASLFDPEQKKRLWRGAINNSGGTALMKRRMREMAEKLVGQLRHDGLL